MIQSYITVDVFTKMRFSGAQIAVFPQAESLTPEQMQLIARELNLSDTVFLNSRASASGQANCFNLQSFSPLQETGFGSHTTVAAAYALAHAGELKLTQRHTPITLKQGGRELLAHVTHEQGEIELTQLSLTTNPIVDNYVPSQQDLAELLSLPVGAFAAKPWRSLLVSNNGIYIVVPVRGLKHLREAQFNLRAWNQSLAPQTAAQQLLLFSTQTELSGNDFHLTLFGPSIATSLQDPPIGAAIPAFSAYLCAHNHIQKGTYTYIAERGWSDRRQSLLHVEMDNKGSDELTLRVGGTAVVVSEGKMTI